jgi:DNA repair protein RadA/Sms
MKLNVRNDDIANNTNILDIVVPEELKKRHRSGLEFFDDALGGQGFMPSSVVLFTGTPGAGKTTMMLELADRLTKSGASVLFNTAEESLHQLRITTQRLGLVHGFIAGQDMQVTKLLAHADAIRAANPGKPFFMIIDSLQTLDDGYFDSGRITSATAERSLQQITDYCKEHYVNAIVIGQVTKSGVMSGSNKLKHMVDVKMSLDVERKDEQLLGCRILEVEKNRTGSCGGMFFLALRQDGFTVVQRVMIT